MTESPHPVAKSLQKALDEVENDDAAYWIRTALQQLRVTETVPEEPPKAANNGTSTESSN